MRSHFSTTRLVRTSDSSYASGSRRRRCRQWVAAAIAVAAGLIPAPGASAADVYIGGGDNATGAFLGYLANTGQWPYVRANAKGYYVNNFALNTNTADATQNSRLSQMSAAFTNKNVFFETDFRDVKETDQDDKVKIDILRSRGFNVSVTACNYGIDASRIDALQWRAWRPVLTMVGPWNLGGNINANVGNNAQIRTWINQTSGSAADGPMGYWLHDTGSMHAGSYSLTKYTHSLGKISMVMCAPYLCSESGSTFLSTSKLCVQQHENQGAAPDIWAVSYYAAQIEQYPVLPEQVNGQPAGTLTGVAYYMIKHFKGLAMLDMAPVDGAQLAAAKGSEDRTMNVAITPALDANGVATYRRAVEVKVAHNDADWLDLCPVLRAEVVDPSKQWDVRVLYGNEDVTSALTEEGGLVFANALRLYAGQSRAFNVVMTRRGTSSAAASAEAKPVDVKFSVLSNPSERENVVSRLTLHATAGKSTAGAAVAVAR